MQLRAPINKTIRTISVFIEIVMMQLFAGQVLPSFLYGKPFASKEEQHLLTNQEELVSLLSPLTDNKLCNRMSLFDFLVQILTQTTDTPLANLCQGQDAKTEPSAFALSVQYRQALEKGKDAVTHWAKTRLPIGPRRSWRPIWCHVRKLDFLTRSHPVWC